MNISTYSSFNIDDFGEMGGRERDWWERKMGKRGVARLCVCVCACVGKGVRVCVRVCGCRGGGGMEGDT